MSQSDFLGGDTDPRRAQHPGTFAVLAEHLVVTFPQLADTRISHAWGGHIDTCSRFSAFWHRMLGGRAVYVGGFTGLGVGASHFGARTALDLLHGRDTERTRLAMVRSKPIPFPPEPLRWTADPADPRLARPGRPQRRSSQLLAPRPRLGWSRLRLLTRPVRVVTLAA